MYVCMYGCMYGCMHVCMDVCKVGIGSTLRLLHAMHASTSSDGVFRPKAETRSPSVERSNSAVCLNA